MGVKGHRKRAGWDNDYLLYALKSFDFVKNQDASAVKRTLKLLELLICLTFVVRII